MTTPLEDEDGFTRLSDFLPDRVDLVGSAANGTRFLIAKQDEASAGLLPAAYVRELIAKTAPEEAPVPQTTEAGETVLPNGIVIKGSPADMAAFFSAARTSAAEPERHPTPADVAKAAMSGKSVNDLPDSDFAFIEGGGKKDGEGKTTPRSLRHFPVNDAAHVRNALARAPQSPFGDKAMPKIKAAAKRLGVEVSKEAGVPDAVTKADPMDAAGDSTVLDEGMDGMDPTVPLAAPDDEMDLPGDPTDPGSPAWEGIDAASAQKWLSIAARLKNALGVLAERETLEAASADPSDIENAWNLEDAMCAVDFAIEQLAVFAAGEQAEAELGAEMEEMCKALAAFDPAPLTAFEGLAAVRKSGRVLSAANESAIRQATESLQKVLASLPSAPQAAEPVAKEKEAAMPATATAEAPAETVTKERSAEEQARDTGPVNAGGTTGMGQPRTTGPAEAAPADGPQGKLPGDVAGRTVVKSAGLPVVVYNRAGQQCITRPDAILDPVAKADDGGDGKVTMQAVFDENGNLVGIVDPADITPVAGAGGSSGAEPDPAAPAADDMQPQPPADAGMPADAVGKAVDEDVITLSRDVLKSIAQDAAKEALEAQGAAHQEVVAKMAADNGELREELKVVKERLVTVENTPAAQGVFTNGAVPPADGRPLPAQNQLRGQDAGGGSRIDIAKAAELKQELYTGSPARQVQVAGELTRAAVAELSAIHAAAAR